MISENDIKSQVIGKQPGHQGKWLMFHYLNYTIGDKIIENYEMVERTTRKGDIDGVDICAVLTSKSTTLKKMIFIANFRPPVGKFVLEMPAGLIENENDFIEDAFRELKEETGYTGKKLLDVAPANTCPLISPILYVDPWKSNENGKIVLIEVDGDDPINQDAKPSLEESENIKVYLLDLDRHLANNIETLANANGYLVETKLYAFALGISFAKNFDF